MSENKTEKKTNPITTGVVIVATLAAMIALWPILNVIANAGVVILTFGIGCVLVVISLAVLVYGSGYVYNTAVSKSGGIVDSIKDIIKNNYKKGD